MWLVLKLRMSHLFFRCDSFVGIEEKNVEQVPKLVTTAAPDNSLNKRLVFVFVGVLQDLLTSMFLILLIYSTLCT